MLMDSSGTFVTLMDPLNNSWLLLVPSVRQVPPVRMNFDVKKYEGAEKLLEVWFFYDEDRTSLCCGCPDLRELKRWDYIFKNYRFIRAQIEHLLKMAHCQIVAESHNKRQFSFVLRQAETFNHEFFQ